MRRAVCRSAVSHPHKSAEQRKHRGAIQPRENFPDDLARVFAARLNPELENPVGRQIRRDFEGQANSHEEAIAQDKRDGKKCHRGGLCRE
jgi:hypothetical protein